MPTTGDFFIIKLKQAHLEWGTHRHTSSRGITYGEGYLQIPRTHAKRLNITNGNLTTTQATYQVSSSDGFLNRASIKAAGSGDSNDIYAKQLQGDGNLKIIGAWFDHVNAKVGDQVEIKWISPTEFMITKL
jgi:hypothetical protein